MRSFIPSAALVLMVLLSCSRQETESPGLSEIQLRIEDRSSGAGLTRLQCGPMMRIPDAGGREAYLELVPDDCVSTRSSLVTAENLDAIDVWARRSDGTNYFYDLRFSKDPSDGLYKSSPVYRWINGSPLDLYCYYPCSSDFMSTGLTLAGTDEIPTITYDTPGNANSHKDMLVGCVKGAAEGTPQVGLKHVLSSICFKVGDNLPVGTIISSIEIRGIVGKGVISLGDPSAGWTLDESKLCYPFVGFSSGAEWTKTEGMTYGEMIGPSFFLLPQATGEDCSIQIFRKEGGKLVCFTFDLDCRWEMGKSYSFYLNLN